MYCSSCGTEQPQELSYCNRCGTNLRPVALQSGEAVIRHRSIAGLMVVGSIFITLGGFFTTIFVLMAFITRGLSLEGAGGALIAVILFITLGIDFMLLRTVTRLLELKGTSRSASDGPRVLTEPVRRTLEEPRVPPVSVTDHTTRTLPPVYVERPETKEI